MPKIQINNLNDRHFDRFAPCPKPEAASIQDDLSVTAVLIGVCIVLIIGVAAAVVPMAALMLLGLLLLIFIISLSK